MEDNNVPKVTATVRVLKYNDREPDGGEPDEIEEKTVDLTKQYKEIQNGIN